MELFQYRCVKCGEDLKIKDDICECEYCGASYHVDATKEYAEEVRRIFGDALAEQKEEAVANCRRNLWREVNAEHVSSTQVLNYVNELKKLLPDDFQANFYEVATCGTAKQINSFLNNVNVSKQGCYIESIADYLLSSLESSNVLPLKDLVTRGLKDEKYADYITKIEGEALKLKDGLYSPQVPRDVFIAYSSKDYKAVNEVVEFLEENKISCFVALRNLRHVKGAVENYLAQLRTAMHNCKCVVFLSSNNSRDLDCDALKVELPYIKNSEPQMGRIEYLLTDYGEDTSYAAKRILENFFNGLEYCRIKEDLVDRILEYITGEVTEIAAESKEKIKYCTSCGEKNPAKAKCCMECGSVEFVDRYEDYLRAKLEKEYSEKFRKQCKELERVQAEKAVESKTKEELQHKEQESIASERTAVLRALEEEAFKAQEEEVRKAAEKTKAERKVKESYPTLANYDKSEFEIESTTLKKYKGSKFKVVIPQGVTLIGENAFSDCKKLISVTIPNSVTTIGEWAFKNCCCLTNIVLPKGVVSINACAFWCCKSLTRVVMPNSVTSIGSCAFSDCKSLTNITIPDSVDSIGRGVFNYCSSLESITVETNNKTYYSKGNCLIDIVSKTLIRGCGNSVIPADGNVTSIGKEAFIGCEKLKSISIPYGVTSIGDEAFRACKSLASITIPNSLILIGEGAFEDCSSLPSIIIPKSVAFIGKNAFFGFGILETINCESETRPPEWDKEWLGLEGWAAKCKTKIVWGYKS